MCSEKDFSVRARKSMLMYLLHLHFYRSTQVAFSRRSRYINIWIAKITPKLPCTHCAWENWRRMVQGPQTNKGNYCENAKLKALTKYRILERCARNALRHCTQCNLCPGIDLWRLLLSKTESCSLSLFVIVFFNVVQKLPVGSWLMGYGGYGWGWGQQCQRWLTHAIV